MGTDINYIFQKKNVDHWETIDGLDMDIHFPDEGGYVEGDYYIGRNYLLFAVLAGVRNGYGFAGVYRHEPLQPIAEPRGFPDGIKSWHHEPSYTPYGYGCDEPDENVYLDLGDHSFTWLTSTEILDWFSKEHFIYIHGIVSVEDYHKWDKISEPNVQASDISGNGIVTGKQIGRAHV